jgi:hypothetical protein
MVIVAIDTRNKRFSLIGFGSPVPAPLPLPDSTISAGDRAMLLWLYFGLALALPEEGVERALLVFNVIVDDIITFATTVDDILTFEVEV